MMTSMLSTMAHALSEDMVEYAGRAEMAVPDSQLLGLGARWRLYETQQGWVFLAAPDREDWLVLSKALGLPEELGSQDAELARALEERFRSKPASAWERELTAVDVACVEVVNGPVEEVVMLDGKLGEALGIVTQQTHPVIGDYQRLAPVVRFSRSTGVAGAAPLCGAHTDAVLGELGYGEAQIRELRGAKVIG
jgi:crotonobetainyl-CoA:carnitine CoA-transferase CaiB-like acyl-CoA transferase